MINFLKKILFYVNKATLKKHQESNTEPNEEITKYINKIFEQQEKERIARWLVNSIRESLDIDEVISTINIEIEKQLNVDKCIIALLNKENQCLYIREKIYDNYSEISEKKNQYTLPQDWHNQLINEFKAIIINDSDNDNLSQNEKNFLKAKNIKSLIILPLIHKEMILGVIMVHQIRYSRKWEKSHLELLDDTGSQMAVAINQAILYSKIQESTKLKSDFLASMSHELRTPLNAILGFSQMLMNDTYGELNDKQKKFINNITVSGEHLLRLVNDILDLSKIESGNMSLNYEKINAYMEINEVVSILKGLATKKEITIQTNIDKDIYLKADTRKFKQIMYNLISNGIKFTPDKGHIIINAYTKQKNITVEVIDDGIGIPPENKEKIFQSFSQLDSSLTRKQEGTGLGLRLTKKLIDLHNGKIDYYSNKNKGTTFWFSLPCANTAKADTPMHINY